MDLKKHIVYFLLAIFVLVRVEPVFPLLKAIPALTHNIAINITSLCTGTKTVKVLDNVKLDDQGDDNTKAAKKEGEKEAAKSVKEEVKMLLHNHADTLTFYTASNRTLFHLSLSGKVRNHVNDIFRPPLV